jgi:hypothetical protein
MQNYIFLITNIEVHRSISPELEPQIKKSTPGELAKSKKFYDNNKDFIAYERVRKRVMKGAVPQEVTMKRFKLTSQQIDDWLIEGGHKPHKWSKSRISIKQSILN